LIVDGSHALEFTREKKQKQGATKSQKPKTPLKTDGEKVR